MIYCVYNHSLTIQRMPFHSMRKKWKPFAGYSLYQQCTSRCHCEVYGVVATVCESFRIKRAWKWVTASRSEHSRTSIPCFLSAFGTLNWEKKYQCIGHWLPGGCCLRFEWYNLSWGRAASITIWIWLTESFFFVMFLDPEKHWGYLFDSKVLYQILLSKLFFWVTGNISLPGPCRNV